MTRLDLTERAFQIATFPTKSPVVRFVTLSLKEVDGCCPALPQSALWENKTVRTHFKDDESRGLLLNPEFFLDVAQSTNSRSLTELILSHAAFICSNRQPQLASAEKIGLTTGRLGV